MEGVKGVWGRGWIHLFESVYRMGCCKGGVRRAKAGIGAHLAANQRKRKQALQTEVKYKDWLIWLMGGALGAGLGKVSWLSEM